MIQSQRTIDDAGPGRRILLVDFNVTYVNKTRDLIVKLLDTVGHLRVFGPGYVEKKVLDKGVSAFADTYGPFDFVMASEHVWASQGAPLEVLTRGYHRNYSYSFKTDQLRSGPIMLQDIRLMGIPLIAFALETDYYNVSLERVNDLFRAFDYVVGWNDQFLISTDEMKVNDPLFGGIMTDAWRDMVLRFPLQVIPLAHFVDDDEFDHASWSARPLDLVVPGVLYSERRELLEQLLKERRSIRVGRGSLARNSRRLSNSLRIPQRVELQRWLFRRDLRRAKLAFVSGSSLRYPVRKFFEVPANGCGLVAQPCQGFSALGFQNHTNCWELDDSSAISRVREILVDPGISEEISRRGQLLIKNQHSLTARAEQLSAALDRIERGLWRGARWRNGALMFDSS